MAELEIWDRQGEGLTIAEGPVEACILRVARGDADARDALAAAFDMTWPAAVNQAVGEPFLVASLAPGEWLIRQPASNVRPKIEHALAGRLHHLSDVSAGRRLWRIDGPHARELMARGCSIDTHPRSLPAGRCAQTLFAQIHVLLIVREAGRGFDIIADASLAKHLRAWFEITSLDFNS